MQEIGKVLPKLIKKLVSQKSLHQHGIAPALYAAQVMGVPMIFAKKLKTSQ